MSGLLTPKAAAAYLGVSATTFIRLVGCGRIKYIHLGAGTVRHMRRLDVTDLEAFKSASKFNEPAIVVVPPGAKRNTKGQLVYFIKAGRRLKIGIAKNPRARLSVLQTAHPEPLELIAIIGGGAKVERQLHNRFAKYRLGGEWFSIKGELVGFLKTVDLNGIIRQDQR